MIARLAIAYARRRPLSTALVVLLLALGLGVVTLTVLLAQELSERMTRDAQGIDLVVGAKGSPLQLVLCGVYHVDVPTGNIPLAAVAQLRANPLIAEAIPLALGDSFRGAWIVGSEPELIEHYGAHLAAGTLWSAPMEAVLGSAVAEVSGLKVGDHFTGSHGLALNGPQHVDHPYLVTGIATPTGTVLDRMVVTSIASVWVIHEDHDENDAKDAPTAPTNDAGSGPAAKSPATPPSREVTLVLVRYRSPLAAATLPRMINATTDLVAASPALETARLLTVFGVGTDVLRGFAWLLVAASALMLFVALAQALEERRYDLAILRTLGATPLQVAGVLLLESLALSACGALLGIALGHLAAAAIATWLPTAATLAPAARRWLPDEWLILALALGAGILAAWLPAWRAARLDVAATLADN